MDLIAQAFASLTWQAAFAIVASVVAIVTGLFGYMISARKTAAKHKDVPVEDAQLIHTRISELKDRLGQVETDTKVALTSIKALQKQLDDHEERDSRDSERLHDKMDRMTEILMKILTDEKL